EEFARRGDVSGAALGLELHRGRAEFLLKSAAQLERAARDRAPFGEARAKTASDAPLLRALLAAFPDRLVRRRDDDDADEGGRAAGRGGDARRIRGVMVGGRGVRLADESAVRDAELFVAVELAAGAEESLVRQASAVERDWLDPARLTTSETLRFDRERETVV